MKTWKKNICILLMLCIVLGTVTSGAFAVEYTASEYAGTTEDSDTAMRSRPFLDVGRNDWFFSAVYFVSTQDIMRGTSATHFSPQGNFSRAMVVTTLFRIYHGRIANTTDPRNTPFHDVATTGWYAPYISWAHENDIVDGLPDGSFAPNSPVSRQQFATMLHRYVTELTDMDAAVHEGTQWSNFVDRDNIALWAYDALAWANYHGIITGRGGNQIAPGATATRAEAATMLTRFMGGDTNAPVSPLPESLNIADLLDANFIEARLEFWYIFGDIVGAPVSHWAETWLFQSGALIGVDANGRIGSITIDFMQPGGERFHYDGLGHRATPDAVREALGEPTISDGISYTYWLGGEVFAGPNLSFFIDSHTGRIGMISFMHVPLAV